MARVKKPGIKIVITAVAELAEFADGLGVVLRSPITPGDVVEAVRHALRAHA